MPVHVKATLIPAIAALLTCAVAAAAHAQPRVTFDAAVGASAGDNRSVDHTGFSADLAVSLRGPLGTGRWSMGLAAATEGHGPHGDKCRLVGSDGPCLGPLTFRSAALLLGGSHSLGFVELGAALGPAVYAANDGFTVGAFQVRADVAIPATSRAALLVTARRSTLGSVYGARYRMNAVTLGLRLRPMR